jgi:hypothetical protein
LCAAFSARKRDVSLTCMGDTHTQGKRERERERECVCKRNPAHEYAAART